MPTAKIKVESFPNREVRATLYNMPSPRWKGTIYQEEESTQEDASSLPCHSLKTLNSFTTPQPRQTLALAGSPGYGGLPRQSRFSTYGRRQMLRAGGALETVAQHDECLFLTLTLPGSTKVSMEALSRFSAFAVQRLKAWMGKWLKNNLSMYAWELQKRGALHLHYVVHCPDKERGEYIREHLKRQWIRIIDAIGEASKVDMYEKHKSHTWKHQKDITRVDAQWCEKSVAAYLSKYVSKGKNDKGFEWKPHFCPSRWYGVSRPLLAALRSLTSTSVSQEIKRSEADAMHQNILSVLKSWAVKCYEYAHQVGTGKTIVAYTLNSEQKSIWELIMTQVNTSQDSSTSIESQLRTELKNGVLLMRRHVPWSSTFNQFCAKSRPANLISLPSFKDISLSDLIFVLDMLTYTFRYTQRVRSKLPGDCQLWYANLRTLVGKASSSDLEWMGNIDV